MSAEIAAAATAASSIIGFKGFKRAAKAAEQVGEYNAQLAENEREILRRAKVHTEKSLRSNSDRLIGSQRVATAASGIQMQGSPAQAVADAYFNTELDALRIQYAADIEDSRKIAEAALARTTARSRSAALELQAVESLLAGGSRSAELLS